MKPYLLYCVFLCFLKFFSLHQSDTDLFTKKEKGVLFIELSESKKDKPRKVCLQSETITPFFNDYRLFVHSKHSYHAYGDNVYL